MLRGLQESTREHREKFRWGIRRQIEFFVAYNFFTLFAPVFPSRPAILRFEVLLDRSFHVIIAGATVLNWHTSVVQFPSSNDVIAAAAIIERIFNANAAARISLNGLSAGVGISKKRNFIDTLLRRCRGRSAGKNQRDKTSDTPAHRSWLAMAILPQNG